MTHPPGNHDEPSGLGAGIAAENVVRAPFADQESNAVHEADIADLAAALLHDGHEGHAYEVNGPETLTRGASPGDGTAIGRDVRLSNSPAPKPANSGLPKA